MEPHADERSREEQCQRGTIGGERAVVHMVTGVTTTSLLFGVGTVLGAIAIAAVSLRRDQLAQRVQAGIAAVFHPVVRTLEQLHSGHVGDYVAWLTAGVTAFGAVLAAALR